MTLLPRPKPTSTTSPKGSEMEAAGAGFSDFNSLNSTPNPVVTQWPVLPVAACVGRRETWIPGAPRSMSGVGFLTPVLGDPRRSPTRNENESAASELQNRFNRGTEGSSVIASQRCNLYRVTQRSERGRPRLIIGELPHLS